MDGIAREPNDLAGGLIVAMEAKDNLVLSLFELDAGATQELEAFRWALLGKVDDCDAGRASWNEVGHLQMQPL